MGNSAPSYRTRRINEAIKEIIGTALTQDLKDPRVGFVTLTGVETAPDLSRAKVFVSVYGKQTEKEATLEGLRAARSYLQRLIGDELPLRRIPYLEFVYDGSVDQGMRIQALLKSSGAEELGPLDEPGGRGRMMGSTPGRAVSALEVAQRLKGEGSVLAVSHEAPDGDALGCLSAFILVCEQLGVVCTAYVPGMGELPPEYQFLPRVSSIVRGDLPPVEPGTTVYYFDCASLLRCDLLPPSRHVTRVNIDHHQDNPCYADLNLLNSTAASSTAILHEICKAGGFTVDADLATALYVGLVTDTGRFQYSNTTPAAHRMAAELQESGLDVASVYRLVYESTPLPKLRLLERALCHLEVRLGGTLVTSWLSNEDFAQVGAEEGHAEGIIDTLRRIHGVRVAAIARSRARNGKPETKVSLRSTDGTVDVAALAALRGGGGHTRAAGFTSEEELPAVLDWIESQVEARL